MWVEEGRGSSCEAMISGNIVEDKIVPLIAYHNDESSEPIVIALSKAVIVSSIERDS
jgi:hypothetical protein